MSAFWRPARAGQAAELWCRCDNCYWSGPSHRFTYYYLDGWMTHICDHDWCECNAGLQAALRALGWQPTDGRPDGEAQ